MGLIVRLNELNLKLQGENKLVHQLYRTFQAILCLCEAQRAIAAYPSATLSDRVARDRSSFPVELCLSNNKFS